MKTFEDLYKALGNLTQSQRLSDLTLFCDDDAEFYPINLQILINDENDDMGDVLDDQIVYK